MGIMDKIEAKLGKNSAEQEAQDRMEQQAMHQNTQNNAYSGSNVTGHSPISNSRPHGTHVPGTQSGLTGTAVSPSNTTHNRMPGSFVEDNTYNTSAHPSNTAGGVHMPGSSTHHGEFSNSSPTTGNTHTPMVSTNTNTNTHTTVQHRKDIPSSGTHIPGTNTTIPGTAHHDNRMSSSGQPGTQIPGTHTTIPGTAQHDNRMSSSGQPGTQVPGTHTTIPGTAQHDSRVASGNQQVPTSGTHVPGTHSTIPGPGHNDSRLSSGNYNDRSSGSHNPLSHHNDRTSGSHVPGAALGAGAVGTGAGAAAAGYAAHGSHGDNTLAGDKMRANVPLDPYSSKGQQAAQDAAVARDRDGYGSTTNRLDDRMDNRMGTHSHGRSSTEDADFARNRTGGITNSMSNDTNRLNSGNHGSLENPSAIPIAGGQKVGHDVDPSAPMGATHQHGQHADGTSSHHYGRDAGLVGAGVGAGGLGAHELNKHHDSDRRRSSDRRERRDRRGSSSSSSDRDRYDDRNSKPSTTDKIKNALGGGKKKSDEEKYDDKYNNNNNKYNDSTLSSHDNSSSQHHYGRDAGMVGGVGAAGAGAYELNKHHGRHSPSNTHGLTHSSHGTHDQHSNLTGRNDYNSNPAGATHSHIQPNTGNTHTLNRSSNSPPRDSHLGRNTAIGGGALGAGALGAGAMSHHNKHDNSAMSGNPDEPSRAAKEHVPAMPNDWSMAKKLGGAYEAGYRDAMEHMQGEMSRLRH